jgi:ribosomal protein S27AE
MLDGHLNICKNCVKCRVVDYYNKNVEKRKLYEKERSTRPERKRQLYERTKRRRKDVPGYQKCHNAILRAVRKGIIKKPELCSKCGNGGRIEAHHADYTNPLDVKWLCCKCHRSIHKGKGA